MEGVHPDLESFQESLRQNAKKRTPTKTNTDTSTKLEELKKVRKRFIWLMCVCESNLRSLFFVEWLFIA
jgi:hypothetical protein